jgi:DNA-binding Lrp family transcriptional regulator
VLFLKDTELKILIELLKNSRRSDREISKAVGLSQPTVSRTINKLKQEGYIKEFTIIPDFKKLGFQIMSVIISKVKEEVKPDAFEEVRRRVRSDEKENPHALLLAYTGMGLNGDRATILLSQSYSDYAAFITHAKEHPLVDVEAMQSFIIDLCDESHYLSLTLSQLARYLQKPEKKET